MTCQRSHKPFGWFALACAFIFGIAQGAACVEQRARQRYSGALEQVCR